MHVSASFGLSEKLLISRWRADPGLMNWCIVISVEEIVWRRRIEANDQFLTREVLFSRPWYRDTKVIASMYEDYLWSWNRWHNQLNFDILRWSWRCEFLDPDDTYSFSTSKFHRQTGGQWQNLPAYFQCGNIIKRKIKIKDRTSARISAKQ